MKAALKLAALALALCLPFQVHAHRVWMLPSATVLSGDELWITVDAAVSNDLFYFEHVPMRLDGLAIAAPDGSAVEAENRSTGKFRSTFDVPLRQQGTYRITILNDGLFARYKLDGEAKRWRGSVERLKEIPAAAQDLRLTQSQGRLETFATVGAPDTKVLEPTGKGLELVPITHPNDLVAGETANFKLLLDGAPAADVEVEVVPGGNRYRDRLNDLTVKTNQDGVFSVSWPEPGMYWLSASVEDDKATIPNARRRAGYTVTLEVLP